MWSAALLWSPSLGVQSCQIWVNHLGHFQSITTGMMLLGEEQGLTAALGWKGGWGEEACNHLMRGVVQWPALRFPQPCSGALNCPAAGLVCRFYFSQHANRDTPYILKAALDHENNKAWRKGRSFTEFSPLLRDSLLSWSWKGSNHSKLIIARAGNIQPFW